MNAGKLGCRPVLSLGGAADEVSLSGTNPYFKPLRFCQSHGQSLLAAANISGTYDVQDFAGAVANSVPECCWAGMSDVFMS